MALGTGDVLTREEIFARLVVIVCDQLMVDPEGVTEESSFIEDLGANSLDTVELIMEIEDEFNIEIPDETAEKVLTVGQAIDLVIAEFSKREQNIA